MKQGKRLFAILLALVMIVCSCPLSAFAVNDGTQEGEESFIAPSVTLKADKENYTDGEEIFISAKVKNTADKAQDVKLNFNSTYFVSMEKKTEKVSLDANGKTDVSFTATASHRIFENTKVQRVYDIILGFVFTLIYRITCMFRSDTEFCGFSVDGVPSGVMCTAGKNSSLDVEHTVNFELNYEGAPDNPDSQQIANGGNAAEPSVEREGYQLIGWYRSAIGYSDIFDFSSIVNEDMTLYAKWYDESDTKDSDGDGLPDSLEIQFGSDPTLNDSDEDGIDDYTELNWLNTDPSSTNNGSDDADNDGLTNAEECNIGTNPAYYDTDHDGLSDYDEVKKYKTDPLHEDTDGDKVSDGTEVLIGTDPLVAEKTFSTEANTGEVNESNPVVASATVITGSNGAGTLEINEVTHSDDLLVSTSIPGYLGSAYDFSIDGEFVSANLTFKYDEALGTIGDDFQPRIYYINQETGEFEELPNQKIENGKVTVAVEHFSTYILLNKVDFEKVWESEIRLPEEDGIDKKDRLDVVFVLDSSGSISYTDNQLIKRLTKEFIAKFGENDRAAVVDFDSYASVYSDFTSDKDSLGRALDRIDCSGGTNISSGVSAGIDLFTKDGYKNDSAYKYIILLTDGDGSYSNSYTQKAKDNDIVIFTIGLGSYVRPALLQSIADGTGGKYYFASFGSELNDVFDLMDSEVIDYVTDSNNDGICDYYTNLLNSGNLTLTNGTDDLVGVVDKYGNSADWDGDGLLNGEEIQVVTQLNGLVAIKMKSHPLLVDSDGDGYNDYSEIKKMRTNPLKVTHSGADDVSELKNSAAYVYSEQVDGDYIANKIAGVFDWKKTDESKETFINYFYDYASEKSINQSSEKRKKLADKEKAWEIIETTAKMLKLCKNITDLGTDLGSYDSSVKAQITRYNNKHSDELSLYNKGDYESVIKKYSDIDDFKDSLKNCNNFIDSIAKQSTIDKVDKAISVASAIVKNIDGLKKVKIDLGEKLNNFSNKYQRWLGQRPTGDISYGTVISVATEGIDLVTSVGKINNYYGKLRANAEAFEEYIDLIEYISENGNGKDYVRNAAGDVIKIVLDKSYSEFYDQLSEAVAKESLESFIKMAIAIVGDICPYVKVASTILTIVKVAIGLTGMPAYAQMLVKAQCIDSISDGCVYFISELIDMEGSYFSYHGNNDESVKLYLIQLAQSRIVGEKSMCDYLKTGSISNWISKLINHTSDKETDENFGVITNLIYLYADDLGLILSSKLPKFDNSKWTENNKPGGGFRW